MARVTVTGASDDLIEIGGDLHEEFNWSGAADADDDEQRLLAFSDGTVLRIVYDKDGIWRLSRMATGTAEFTKQEGDVEADTFDVVTLVGDVRWCVFGTHWARKN